MRTLVGKGHFGPKTFWTLKMWVRSVRTFRSRDRDRNVSGHFGPGYEMSWDISNLGPTSEMSQDTSHLGPNFYKLFLTTPPANSKPYKSTFTQKVKETGVM